MSDYEAKTAMQMANTTLDGFSRIVQALIDALSTQAKNPKDRATLREFQDYVSGGGKLLTIPIDKSHAVAFEQLLEAGKITMYKTETVYNSLVYEYLFKSDDERYVSELVMRMRAEGIELVHSSRIDYSVLCERSEGRMHTGYFTDQHEAENYRLHLDTFGIPYSYTQYPDRTELTISSDDYEKLRELPNFAGLRMRDISQIITMQDVREIVQDAAQKRQDEQKRENTRENTRGNAKNRG